jgi:cardiolipin synthase
MRGARRIAERIEQDTVTPVRRMADQAFSRAAGAPLVPGNHVTLLKDAAENYPAWLAAIAAARKTVHFECYIIHEDDTGRQFAGALIEKARQGVKVRLLYDWMGALGKTSRGF